MDDQTRETSTGHIQENDLLFIAIKNKFAAKNAEEAAAFSPPKFTIPILKQFNNSLNQPTKENETNIRCSESPSTSSCALNQFIKCQLNTKQVNGEIAATGLTLPKLQSNVGSSDISNRFVIPLLKDTNSKTQLESSKEVNTISMGIKNLKLTDEQSFGTNQKIDLRSALSLNNTNITINNSSNSNNNSNNNNKARKSETKINNMNSSFPQQQKLPNSTSYPVTNKYCELSISHMQILSPYSKEPSGIGRVLYHNYKINRIKKLKHKKEDNKIIRNVKFKIEPFRFETNSPDDNVLATLQKYQRKSHT